MTQKPLEESTESAASHADEIRTPEDRRRVALTWVVALSAIGVFAVRRPDLAFGLTMFAITLSTLVFVHEWGHYQFALWAGMRVKRFAIGFPPFVYTKRRNGIDYSIGALPIGGMVDIAGLGSEEEMVSTVKNEAAPVASVPADVPSGRKNYQDVSLGWRFLTLFAGPLMNFIFAIVIFAGLFSIVGVPDKITETTIVDVVSPYTPAFKAGLESDDKIVAINGQKVSKPEQAIKIIRSGNGKPVDLQVERGSKALNLKLTPIMEDVDGDNTDKPVPIIGIMFLTRVESYKRVGLFRGETGFGDSAIGTGLQGSMAQAEQIFGLLRRVVTVKMTAQDKRSVGGPVKIAQAVNQSARRSWWQWLLMAGSLSLNLGLMNLLPIPALDGGRIMFIFYEAITRKPFDARKEGLVNAVGMVMVLCFMLFMTFRDVLPFIQKTMQ